MPDPLVFECMVRVGRTPIAGGNAIPTLAGAYGFTTIRIEGDLALMSYSDDHMALRARLVELIPRLHGLRVEVVHYSISVMLLNGTPPSDPLNLLKKDKDVQVYEGPDYRISKEDFDERIRGGAFRVAIDDDHIARDILRAEGWKHPSLYGPACRSKR